MSLNSSYVSCGVSELHGLDHTPSALVREVRWHMQYYGDRLNPPAHVDDYDYRIGQCSSVVFSNTADHVQTRMFVDYIKEHGLGVVVESPVAVNPNSGHDIIVFIWTIDHDALSTFTFPRKGKTSEKKAA